MCVLVGLVYVASTKGLDELDECNEYFAETKYLVRKF